MKRKLTPQEIAEAKKAQRDKFKENPLRRVLLKCPHGWVRDSQAMVSDWVWCKSCNDFSRVIEVAE